MTGFLKGSATALVTPFQGSGVNYEVLKKLVAFQLENGTDALVVLGTTGEPNTMREEEKEETVLTAIKTAAKRCKVIVGTGSNCTEKAVRDSLRAEELGADGVLCVTPYYNKCTQKGIVAYYREIANSVKIPVIVYNVPARTGVNVLPETMAEIAEIPNIAGIKEASGSMAQVMETARLIRGKCDLYSGEDALNLPILAAGGSAVISVVANLLPKEIKKLTTLMLEGSLQEAIALSDRLLPVVKACFLEVNPIPVKAGMRLIGFDAGAPRAPLTSCEEQTNLQLKTALAAFGVTK